MSAPTDIPSLLSRTLEQVAEYTDALISAERACAAHQLGKAIVRTAAIKRIMEQPAPSGKPHSWSSAEALRDTDEQYAAYKLQGTELEARRTEAETERWAARVVSEYLARTLPPVAISFDAVLGQ